MAELKDNDDLRQSVPVRFFCNMQSLSHLILKKCFRYSISTFKHVTVSCKVSAGTCKSKGPLERLLHHSA